jgi:hypothetical protein
MIQQARSASKEALAGAAGLLDEEPGEIIGTGLSLVT